MITTNDRALYRQGDVLFEQISPDPTAQIGIKTAPVAPVEGRHVLARGEKTGHHHSIPASGAVMEVSADDPALEVYLRIMEPTAVVHQEHAPIPLDRGLYRVLAQRTYALDSAPLAVADWE
jgi:hypothetical protein